MQGPRMAALSLAVPAFAALAGCGGSDSTPATTPAAASTHPTVSTAPQHLAGPQPPKAISAFPDGVYRNELDTRTMRRLHVTDPGNAGVWTLTVKQGAYTLDCKTVVTDAIDCGNNDSGLGSLIEVGTVHGYGHTAWFVHDMAKKSRLTHCVRHSMAADGCGPEGGYHVMWKVVPDGLSFSDFVGIGDEAGPQAANWIIQPWTRIS